MCIIPTHLYWSSLQIPEGVLHRIIPPSAVPNSRGLKLQEGRLWLSIRNNSSLTMELLGLGFGLHNWMRLGIHWECLSSIFRASSRGLDYVAHLVQHPILRGAIRYLWEVYKQDLGARVLSPSGGPTFWGSQSLSCHEGPFTTTNEIWLTTVILFGGGGCSTTNHHNRATVCQAL